MNLYIKTWGRKQATSNSDKVLVVFLDMLNDNILYTAFVPYCPAHHIQTDRKWLYFTSF